MTTRSTMSPWACASQKNHGSRESGSGIAPRACIPIAIASYSSWSVVAQSRYSDASTSENMIPNMLGWPVKWYGRPVGLRTSRRPAWTRRPVAWMTLERVGVAEDRRAS